MVAHIYLHVVCRLKLIMQKIFKYLCTEEAYEKKEVQVLNFPFKSKVPTMIKAKIIKQNITFS